MLTSFMVFCFLLVSCGLVRMPDRCRVEGMVEPRNYSIVHMKTSGFVQQSLASGVTAGPAGPALLQAQSPELEADWDQLLADHRRLKFVRQSAQTREAAVTQITDEKMAALSEQIERERERLADLSVRSPISGVWVVRDDDRMSGMYFEQGRRLGVVVDLNHLRIRAVANQEVASRLIEGAKPNVEIRVKGRPDIELTGRIESIIPAGQERLPSAALGYSAGGTTRIDTEDPSGRRAATPFFEILVIPHIPDHVTLRPGQTMVLRFETSAKPILLQGLRSLLQIFQKRITA